MPPARRRKAGTSPLTYAGYALALAVGARAVKALAKAVAGGGGKAGRNKENRKKARAMDQMELDDGLTAAQWDVVRGLANSAGGKFPAEVRELYDLVARSNAAVRECMRAEAQRKQLGELREVRGAARSAVASRRRRVSRARLTATPNPRARAHARPGQGTNASRSAWRLSQRARATRRRRAAFCNLRTRTAPRCKRSSQRGVQTRTSRKRGRIVSDRYATKLCWGLRAREGTRRCHTADGERTPPNPPQNPPGRLA